MLGIWVYMLVLTNGVVEWKEHLHLQYLEGLQGLCSNVHAKSGQGSLPKSLGSVKLMLHASAFF